MPKIALAAPDPETTQTKSFRTHSHYVRAFATLAGFSAFAKPDVVLANLASASVDDDEPPAALDHDDLTGCLHRAWATELLLVMTTDYAREGLVTRLATSWGAVQTYYAGYGVTQALVVALGDPRPTSHDRTQELFVRLWTDTDIAPWSFTYNGKSYAGGPPRPLNDKIHTWTHCDQDNAWDLAAVALKSTRRDLLEDGYARARARKANTAVSKGGASPASGRAPGSSTPARARLDAIEKAKIDKAVGPVSMLDYLYRLRIKANYEDARMFTEGPEHDQDAWRMAQDFVNLTMATMLVHELRIKQLIGGSRLRDLARGWADDNYPSGIKTGLPARIFLL